MSNIGRFNKNSLISLSTNDNTSSLKVNKRMDEADLKRIQRKLADKVHTNNTRKPMKNYKEVNSIINIVMKKTKVRNWLKNHVPKHSKGFDNSTDLKTKMKMVKSYNRILSPQLTTLRSQFNSILDRTRNRKSSGTSKKGNSKVSGLLSQRRNFSKKNLIKTKSSKSENKSTNSKKEKKKKKHKKYEKYDGLSRMKLKSKKSKKSKSSQLERKKSLNEKIMGPAIKYINSEAKLKISKKNSYALFHSPKDFDSKILNISNSYGRNYLKSKKNNLVSNFVHKTNSKSKYLKRMGKKNPLFELKKGVLSKKKSLKRFKDRSRDYSKKRSTKAILSKKNSTQYMKKPMFFEKKAVEIDNLLQLISSRESMDQNCDKSCTLESIQSVDDVVGKVNPLLVKMGEDVKKNLRSAVIAYENEISRLNRKSRYFT